MKKIIPVFALFLITGCVHTLTDDEIKVEYKIPDTFRNNENIIILNDNKSDVEYKDPESQIKSLLSDNSFCNIIEKVSKANPDLLILQSKIRQAEYALKSTTGALAPRVSGGLDSSYGEGNNGKLNGSLSFSWEVDIYGRLDALRKSSKEQIDYAKANLINGRVSLFADTAIYYFSLQKSYAHLIYARKMVENYKSIIDIYTAMQKSGLIDESEYISTTMDYLSAENSMQSYELEVEKNKNALYELLNNQEANIPLIAEYDTTFTPNIPKLTSIPATVILNRPDIRASIYTLNSELYKRYSKKMSLYPSLSLSGNISQLLASPTGIGDFLWQIVGSLTAPLINRQELYADLKIQEESVKQAELTLQKSINTALSDVENSSYAMDSSGRSYRNTKEILKGAEANFEILKSNWQNGLIDDVTYLKAENDYLSTKMNYYSSWYEYISSSVMLYKAFGGSFNPPVN